MAILGRSSRRRLASSDVLENNENTLSSSSPVKRSSTSTFPDDRLSSTFHGSDRRRYTLSYSAHGPDASASSQGRFVQRIPSIMKVSSHDESLHSTFGKENRDKKPDEATDKSVKFDKIEIRTYERALGDNPSCSGGPPLSIGWRYDPVPDVLPVEEYEENRPPRREGSEFVVPRKVRYQMLKEEWNVESSKIASAVRSNVKAKNQRKRTVNNLGKMERAEEIMESAGRKFGRALRGQKRPSVECNLMMKEAERAAALLSEIDEAGMEAKPDDPQEADQVSYGEDCQAAKEEPAEKIGFCEDRNGTTGEAGPGPTEKLSEEEPLNSHSYSNTEESAESKILPESAPFAVGTAKAVKPAIKLGDLGASVKKPMT